MGRSLRAHNIKLALRADSGLSLGNIYPLASKRNILGRSVEVAVPVEYSKVSRNHAAIDCQNGHFYLVDLGSTNGTYLNGQKLNTAKRLSIGDRIRLGSAVYVVELLDQAKMTLSKQWRESTRVIMQPLRSESPLLAKEESSEASKEKSKLEISKKARFNYLRTLRRLGANWKRICPKLNQENLLKIRIGFLSVLALSLVLAAILL